MFFSIFPLFYFKSLYEYLDNQKNLPSRSQDCILFWNILRRLSKLSAGKTKTFCYFSVTGGKRNSLFPLMLYDLWSLYLSAKKPSRASKLICLFTVMKVRWPPDACFIPHSPLFPSRSSNTYVRLSLVWRDAVYTRGFLHFLWPLSSFIRFDVECTVIKSVFSVAHKVWFQDRQQEHPLGIYQKWNSQGLS